MGQDNLTNSIIKSVSIFNQFAYHHYAIEVEICSLVLPMTSLGECILLGPEYFLDAYLQKHPSIFPKKNIYYIDVY